MFSCTACCIRTKHPPGAAYRTPAIYPVVAQGELSINVCRHYQLIIAIPLEHYELYNAIFLKAMNGVISNNIELYEHYV